MPVLSKTSIPSLTVMITARTPAVQFPMLESNTRFWKQARCLNSLDNLNAIALPVQKDGNSVAYSHQKKCQTLVPKRVLNLDPMRNLNTRDEHEFSKWTDAFLLVVLIWNCLQKNPDNIKNLMSVMVVHNMLRALDSQKPTISGEFFLQVPLEMIFAKCLKRFLKSCGMRSIFNAPGSQMPLKTRKFSMYINFYESSEISVTLDPLPPQILSEMGALKNSEQLKLPEISVSDTALYNPPPQIAYMNQRKDEMKLLKMCYLCQETISKKDKFFDKRRFVILNNCDCMICYACIPETVRKAGWVKGPVTCPSCSLESDTIATNYKWIEGKEKLEFFRAYMENTKFIRAQKAWTDTTDERAYKQLSNYPKYLSHIFINNCK